MGESYSSEICRRLEKEFHSLQLHRPMRVECYEPGTVLRYEIQPVEPGPAADIELQIGKFVGGGFAGQVYQVKILSITVQSQSASELEGTGLVAGGFYAMKIMIPPSKFSLVFRNALYAVGFQSQFQLQVNPTAARAGALWQKFIRSAAKNTFGDAGAVNDVHATFTDTTLGGCGELSDWVNGRTWRLEVDDNMDLLQQWKKGKIADDDPRLGSPEYRCKYKFMSDFVDLLHQLGAHEFARQYEWSTCKSQPNCLKRTDAHDSPVDGLTAVDFRAGLALLPCLPMSPGDFKLIPAGLMRGSIVQFDRGNISELKSYLNSHPLVKEDLPQADQMLAQLEDCEKQYRDAQLDITHNFPRLLYDKSLWKSVFTGAANGWYVRNLVEQPQFSKLTGSWGRTFLFWLIGLFPLVGGALRKWWGKADWREHYKRVFTSWNYLIRAIQGRICERVIAWHRSGRISAQKAEKMHKSLVRYFFHRPFAFLPIGLHKFLTDKDFFKHKLHYLFIRPIKLYFNADLRSQWLLDMVEKGREKDVLSEADAATILERIDEPFIQRYLISMVVHLMTLPVTQIVSLAVAGYFYFSRPDLSQAERTAIATGIFALFQVIPLSPGSLCRGLYTTGMAIHDRNFKEYNIALFLSYFKYVGYLAFPIQMTYRYPVMARFMAAHWATDAVRLVPVFGERGALLEHGVFCLFYNWPLTIRRRLAQVSERRRGLSTRLWHLAPILIISSALLISAHYGFRELTELRAAANNIWYLRPLLPLFILLAAIIGVAVTHFAGGMQRTKRIAGAAATGVLAGVFYTAVVSQWESAGGMAIWAPLVWRCFALAIFSSVGAIIKEVAAAPVSKVPNPDKPEK